MATFAAHVIVHGETGSVQFAPGDEVPEWAVDQVGAHVLEPEETPADEQDESDESDEHDGQDQDEDGDGEGDSEGEDDTPPPADDLPDFTAPTPARRGRSRKQ